MTGLPREGVAELIDAEIQSGDYGPDVFRCTNCRNIADDAVGRDGRRLWCRPCAEELDDATNQPRAEAVDV